MREAAKLAMLAMRLAPAERWGDCSLTSWLIARASVPGVNTAHIMSRARGEVLATKVMTGKGVAAPAVRNAIRKTAHKY